MNISKAVANMPKKTSTSKKTTSTSKKTTSISKKTTSKVRYLMKPKKFALVHFIEENRVGIVPTSKVVEGEAVTSGKVSVLWQDRRTYEATVLMTEDDKKELQKREAEYVEDVLAREAEAERSKGSRRRLTFPTEASEEDSVDMTLGSGMSPSPPPPNHKGSTGMSPSPSPQNNNSSTGVAGEEANNSVRFNGVGTPACHSTPARAINSPVIVNVPRGCCHDENSSKRFDELIKTVSNMTTALNNLIEKFDGQQNLIPHQFNLPELEGDDEADEGINYLAEDVIFDAFRKSGTERRRFAARLNRLLFTKEERKTSNVSGTRGKNKLDENKIDYIKRKCFKFYACATVDKISQWSIRTRAIDDANRALNRMVKSSEQ